ncbi:MAG: uridine kinase [Fimbriiglobus sp.]
MSIFTIGIAGGSGSGKSTIVEQLLALEFGSQIAHLAHDAYYRNRIDMPEAVASSNNWDHPDALDTALYLKQIDILKSGQPIAAPIYDFGTHSRSSDVHMVAAQPILLLEGILLFSVPALRERIDLKIYVDTPSDLRIVRRITRDVIERKRSVESVVDQYQSTVRPMHAIFVEPSRQFADIIIPWEHHNPQAIDLLAAKIRQASR